MSSWRLLIALVLAALTMSCVEADLGPVPLYCNPGEPHCPKGYRCVAYEGHDYCVREGDDPAQVLGGSSDGGWSH
jgi:hypothetical protein